jgi:hypothetical protein
MVNSNDQDGGYKGEGGGGGGGERRRRLTWPPSLASTVAVSPFNLMILAVNLIV